MRRKSNFVKKEQKILRPIMDKFLKWNLGKPSKTKIYYVNHKLNSSLRVDSYSRYMCSRKNTVGNIKGANITAKNKTKSEGKARGSIVTKVKGGKVLRKMWRVGRKKWRKVSNSAAKMTIRNKMCPLIDIMWLLRQKASWISLKMQRPQCYLHWFFYESPSRISQPWACPSPATLANVRLLHRHPLK